MMENSAKIEFLVRRTLPKKKGRGLHTCKAILVDLCARPANYDWARLVALAPQVDVRAQLRADIA